MSFEKVAFFFIFAGVGLVIIHLFMFYFDGLILKIVPLDVLQSLGQFGEYNVSMIEAIWSLASVILFYETLRFQRQELILQRHELELNRNELLEQTQQIRDQNKLVFIQTIENTFFQLLMLQTEIVKSVTLNVKAKGYNTSNDEAVPIITGRDCFVEYYKYFKNIYTDHVDLLGIASPNRQDMFDTIEESFEKFYGMFHSDLGHYLRNIYSIVEFIDTAKMDNKVFYKKLVVAQLSDHELLLLFYYCLSKRSKDFKLLVEKYSLFINLPEPELLDIRHKDLFDRRAFGY